MRRLARALYPATLAEPATLAATAAALERGGAEPTGMRLVLQEQEAILRAVLAARSVAAAVALSPVIRRRYSSRAAASAGTSTE